MPPAPLTFSPAGLGTMGNASPGSLRLSHTCRHAPDKKKKSLKSQRPCVFTYHRKVALKIAALKIAFETSRAFEVLVQNLRRRSVKWRASLSEILKSQRPNILTVQSEWDIEYFSEWRHVCHICICISPYVGHRYKGTYVAAVLFRMEASASF